MPKTVTPMIVALRKESVDRNIKAVVSYNIKETVALRKESVDRNSSGAKADSPTKWSLSARRAWIEIPAGCWRDARRAVALRKESVDRNLDTMQVIVIVMESLSARRAWIEIRGGALMLS